MCIYDESGDIPDWSARSVDEVDVEQDGERGVSDDFV